MGKILPVNRDSGYRTADALDDVDLEEGEHLAVRWPDGTETIERVRLHRTYYADGSQTRAYVRASVRGAYVRLDLEGHEARRPSGPECWFHGQQLRLGCDECERRWR